MGESLIMFEDVIKDIQPLSDVYLDKARLRQDDLTKPRGSLGRLEEIAIRVVGIREDEKPSVEKKEIFVFTGDHDVVEEGVSAYPQEVTGQMVMNFIGGGAGINVISRCANANVNIIDIGMKDDLKDAEGLIKRNIRRAAGNIAKGPAMTIDEAKKAIELGMEMADKAFSNRTAMIATGEMGIGNTTPSAALFAALLPSDVPSVTGMGTGIDEDGLKNKIRVIEKALEVNKSHLGDPLSALAAVGGLEIAGICGLCLGGAARRIVVVVDGFISSAGALVAMRLNPLVKDYLFFSHQSVEKGHKGFFEREGIRPLLNLDMRLGEGTGAGIAMQIIEDAVKIHNEMATFADVGIEPGA